MSNAIPGLDGLSIIVTGAARGQGALEAEILASSGAHVVMADVLEEQGNAMAEKITANGKRATFVTLDITDAEGWARVTQEALRATGRIDALINNAGIAATPRLHELDRETFQRVMEVNVFGAVLGINAVTPTMASQGEGSIVNVSSVAGQTGWPSAAYAMSKWAMTGLTKTAALELGPLGVRVNSVHPGPLANEFAADMPQALVDSMIKATPLGRLGLSEDVAPLVGFLCSPSSQWISGAEFSVDGGFMGAGGAHAIFGGLPAEAR